MTEIARPRIGRVVFRSALIAAGVTAAYRVGKRYRRFAITGRSMIPVLLPGDWVLVDEHVYRRRLPKRGHVVIARDPREPDRHLVKRVTAVDLHGNVQIEGDNADESTDSRHFGPVPRANLVGRVRWCYWPARRIGSVL